MKSIYYSSVLFLLCLLNGAPGFGQACTGVTTAERDALIALYNATGGDNWTNQLNNIDEWDVNIANNDVCDWYGVTVENGHVTELRLGNNNLITNTIASPKDAIPSEIWDLTYLEVLDLGNNNQLTGALPNIFTSLTSLNLIDIRNCNFSGSLPSGLNNITNLYGLFAGGNEFSGNVPLITSLTGSFPPSALIILSLVDNNFVFGDLRGTYASYSGNSALPYFYDSQSKVGQSETVNLIVGDNYTLTGSAELVDTANLYDWQFSSDGGTNYTSIASTKNHTLTNVDSGDSGIYRLVITNSTMTQLTLEQHPVTINVSAGCIVPQSEKDALEAFYNATGGDNWTTNTNWNSPTVPVCDWYGVTVENGHVTKLELDSNKLINSIPSDLQFLTNLEVLSLFKNKLAGNIPLELGQLTSLKHLNLDNVVSIGVESGTRTIEGLLTGSIPTQFANLTNLEFLGLSANQLSGGIPPGIAAIATLDTLRFGDNKFVFNDFEPEHTTYDTNLNEYWYSPQAKVDQEEVIIIPVGGTSTPLSTSLSNGFNTYQWQFSSDGGETYADIPGATGHDYTITNATVAEQGLYRLLINNTKVTGLTLERYPISVIVGSSNSFCTNDIETPTVADLLPQGSNIAWYIGETGGSPLNGASEIRDEAYDLAGVSYWWDDTTDGVATRTESTVFIDNRTPEGDVSQQFSLYASPSPTIADIEVYNGDDPIYWYASDSSSTVLASNTSLVDGVTYYASSCDAGDDTCSCRLPVTISLEILAPEGDEIQFLCENNTLNDIVLQLEPGMSVAWYGSILINVSPGGGTSVTLTNPLVGSTPLTDGTSYYAVQKYSNGDEGSSYLKVTVELSSAETPVVLETTQTFYANESQTVGDLQAFGNDIKWYSQPTNGNPYPESTALVHGTTYYAEQNTKNSACPSTSRVAVTAELSAEVADPLLGCELFRPELLEHYVIDAWINEREVTTQQIDQIAFNNSDESELFVALLNHLKNRLLSDDPELHDIPEVYEPELSPDETQLDFALLMPYIEGLEVGENNLTVYGFDTIDDDYGRAIGFSFYLNARYQDQALPSRQFIYKTPTFTYTVPRITSSGVEQDNITEHYPLLDNVNYPSDEFLNFTNVEVAQADGAFTIHADFQRTLPTPSLISHAESLSDNGVMKFESIKNEFTEVAYQTASSYESAKIEVSFVDINNQAIGTPIVLQPQGGIIDKWQKVTADFEVPGNAGKMIIALRNTDQDRMAYFDDVRILPFDSNMKTFVYHPENQRLMSELDENNYATFYEYDLEGGLVRVKKETEKGIYTIQETRSGNVKAGHSN